MNERDQVISFLLSANDNKDRIIADLRKQLTELQKPVESAQTAQ
jgi:hypothetical protein